MLILDMVTIKFLYAEIIDDVLMMMKKMLLMTHRICQSSIFWRCFALYVKHIENSLSSAFEEQMVGRSDTEALDIKITGQFVFEKSDALTFTNIGSTQNSLKKDQVLVNVHKHFLSTHQVTIFLLFFLRKLLILEFISNWQ